MACKDNLNHTRHEKFGRDCLQRSLPPWWFAVLFTKDVFPDAVTVVLFLANIAPVPIDYRQTWQPCEHRVWGPCARSDLGGAASHCMDATAMDVLMERIGWGSSTVASRLVGVTASEAASRGTRRSLDTLIIETDTLPLSVGFVESYASFAWDNQRKQSPEGARLDVWG